MFNINCCEIAMQEILSQATTINVGIGTTTKDYTDTGLEIEVFDTAIDSTEDKGNGEGLIIGTVDYADAVGETLTENGIVASSGQIIVDSNFALEKNANEKYIYYYYGQILPKESLL
jgi:hypothetical protein